MVVAATAVAAAAAASSRARLKPGGSRRRRGSCSSWARSLSGVVVGHAAAAGRSRAGAAGVTASPVRFALVPLPSEALAAAAALAATWRARREPRAMSMPGLALEVLLGLVAGGMVDEGLQERLRDGVASR